MPDQSRWWDAVDAGSDIAVDGTVTTLVQAAAQKEAALLLDEAERLLEQARPLLTPSSTLLFRLIELRLRARRGADFNDVDQGFDAVVDRTADDDATAARALLSQGTLRLRNSKHVEAEATLHKGLARASAAPRRLQLWFLDAIAQVYLARGAWEEARFVLRRVVVEKRALADVTGVAISSGNLAVLHLARGEANDARVTALAAIDEARGAVSAASQVRLLGIALQAELDDGRAGASAPRLTALLERSSDHTSLGRGHAALALARAAAAASDSDGARRWLDDAGRAFAGADKLLLAYWEATLFPERRARAAFVNECEALLPVSGPATEGEIRLRLLLADVAFAAGRKQELRAHLDEALDRSQRATAPTLPLLVAERFAALDAARFAERSHERYSGRSASELKTSSSEEATLVFCDMVGFSTRAGALEPDEVMALVRGLFEHAAPLLAQHQVRPLQHLGDGLLAAAQGPGHHARAVAFARAFVARVADVGRARKALGEAWVPALRAGVATGRVVFGVLGTAKQEYLAIGNATNLAARLQAEARPGEVCVFAATAKAAGLAGIVEEVRVKGFDGGTGVVRFGL